MTAQPIRNDATIYRITNPEHPDQDWLDYRAGSGGTVEIFDIVVNSERGKGVGRRLVETLFNSLDVRTRVWAVTRTTNPVAQQFYERLGFRVLGVLRDFYRPDPKAPVGVDAVMYGRKAGGPV